MKEFLKKEMIDLEESRIRQFNDITKKLKANVILTLGEPDFDTPEEIKQAGINAIINNQTKYGPTLGTLPLREKICEFEKRINNVDYGSDEVIITAGSTEAIATAIFSVLNPGDEVIIPTPSYPLYRQIVEFSNGKYVPLDTTKSHFQIEKDDLLKCITDKTKAIIITSPNNPTGNIYNDETLEVIHQAVKGKPIFVICDDCYNQLVYGERKLGFSKYQDIKSQIIVCQSFSKPYAMTGWRIGYLLADRDIVSQCAKIHQYMVVAVNTFIQPAAIKALDFNPKVFVDSYRERRDYAYNRLLEMGFEVEKPEGAFYLFPSIKKFGLSSYDFCYQLAEKKGVAIIPGYCFEADDYIRISYCVSLEVIKKALDLIEQFIKEL